MSIELTGDQYKQLTTTMDYGGSIRPRYSGRGMYGATCLAYVGDDVTLFLFDLARILANDEDASGELHILDGSDALELVRDKIGEIGTPSSDAMGFDTVYYWRNVQVMDDNAETYGDED